MPDHHRMQKKYASSMLTQISTGLVSSHITFCLAGRVTTNHRSRFQVRSVAYIQSLFSLLLFGLGSKYDGVLRGTLVLTSLALIAAIAIFSIKTELSLHHATISLTLMTVVMLLLYFVESWWIESPGLFVAQQLRLGTYSAM